MDTRKFGRQIANHWLSRQSLPLIDTSLTMADAQRARDVFLSEIQPLMGRPLGYKAAAITPPAQRDLGISEPLGGIYLAGMFSFLDGAPIPIDYAARPIAEAKLLVAVKDERINSASSLEEVAGSIAYLLPCIELGDSLVDPEQQMTAPILTAYNVGARAVQIGPPIPFNGDAGSIDQLQSFMVTTSDRKSGEILDQNIGSSMMGHPIEAALWIVRDQASRGVKLTAGDRLGLGAMSRVRPTAGQTLAMHWEGLTDEPIELNIEFCNPSHK